MRCVECDAANVSERRRRTTQDYRRFRCRTCGKQFNERSGGVLNRAQYPFDVIALVIFWRLHYKLNLRDLPEMFLIRGIEFSYEAVRDWEVKLTSPLVDSLRRWRAGRIGKSWYVDETYIKGNGRWCYLYHAIDRSGALVDVRLSEKRDMAAAKAFFRSAKAVTGARTTSADIDTHTRSSVIRLHHSALNPDCSLAQTDKVFRMDDEPGHDELCAREQGFLLRAIREDADLADHMQDAVNSLRIVLAADESVHTKRVIAL
jgi:transposase-like protein